MKELVNSIEKQIETDKEVINVLPRNGIKSIKTLLETIKDMIDKYNYVDNKLLENIEERYNQLTDVKEFADISKLEQEIQKYNSAIKIIDSSSSYEKMGLDKIEYNINGYYKSNLERLNKELIECVKKFEIVGIKITAEDFNISENAKEYMKVLLEEAYNGQINSEKIKEAFEGAYWNCSEVVSHLYANIRYLYDIHKNEINKYFQIRAENIVYEFNCTREQIENKKAELIKKKKLLENIDNKIILNKFFNGTWNINDYKEDNYNRIYLELISTDVKNLQEKEKCEMDENIEKLNENLIEYSRFNEYKFLSDTVLQIREEELRKNEANKDKKVKKTQYDILKDNIKELTVEIFKLNEKINKPVKGLFAKHNDKDKKTIILKRNNSILELKKLYMELDDEIVKQKIIESIDETSSLLDVLKLGSNFYSFMAKAIIKKNDEITDKELGEMAKRIRDFIMFSNFSVINYVKISDKKDLSIIIKDKYKLFGMQVSKENFQEENIEDLMRKVRIISNYNNILKSKFSIKDLEYITTVKEFLKR